MAEESAQTAAQKVVIDTDVLIWYLRGHNKARRFLQLLPYRQRTLSSLTLMELLQGCRNQDEARLVKAFVTDNISFIIHPDEIISRRAIALLEQHTFSHGLRLVDALIAATALENGSSLATANVKHYRAIAGLHRIPFKP
jgi:predicted nucleic acid-binding protein